jgi:D-arabinose 1-dehydrogenase-like Zn-dependent alcohol dehydrogenase
MKAAVVHDFTQPLSIEDVPRPEPSDGQVLVRIDACGLCHTDIHAAHGDRPIKPPLPLIPGHEGVGIVEALGPGAGNEVSVGDRVVISPADTAGTATRAGRRSARRRSTPATAWTAGTPSMSPPMRGTS